MNAPPPLQLDYAKPHSIARRRRFQFAIVLATLLIAVAAAWRVWRPKPIAMTPLKLAQRATVYDGGWLQFRPEQYPNLDPQFGRPRPPTMVPVGTVNLARGKTVTSSDPNPTIGTLGTITDGQTEVVDLMRDALELAPGLQWVQIDLGARRRIYAIVIWRPHGPDPYRDVIVQLSDDPAFKTGVTTLFNNDRDNSSGLGGGRDWEYVERDEEGKVIDAKGVRARHVRVYAAGNRNYVHQYAEIEVYGPPTR